MKYIEFLQEKYIRSSSRSKEAVNNIALSFVSKGTSIICTSLIGPVTINYVNPTQYGIWLTLSSIIGWISFFDLGLGNGFRNKFAETKAIGNIDLAKQYVSTTYFTIALMMLVLFVILAIANLYVDWPKLLNVNEELSIELSNVFLVLSFFFCLNMIVRLFTTILTADQKPGVASLVGALGQVLSLIAIYVLTLTTSGSLINLALFYSSIPTLLLVLCSIYAFHFTGYSKFSPHIKYANISLIKDIMNLGMQFFIIYLCMIAVFQIINIIISRELGPDAVTEYNIAYKYFFVLYNVFMIIVTPFWSAFTDAYVKKDKTWMLKAKRGLEIACLCTILAAFAMLLLSNWFYHVWIGDSVVVHFSLSFMMALYIISMNIGGMYMNLVNGIGTMRIQLIIYVLFAVFSYPAMLLLVRNWGIPGIVAYPAIVAFIQAIMAKLQIEKIINGTATDFWLK